MKVDKYCHLEEEKQALRQLSSTWERNVFWSGEEILNTLAHSTCQLWYIGSKNAWQAMLLASLVPEYAELLFIYSSPRYRRQGYAEKLLRHFIEFSQQRGCSAVLLEVRASNRPAIQLYESLGFYQLQQRPSYYRDGEDALILRKQLDEVEQR